MGFSPKQRDMSYLRVWIHVVWGNKSRQRILTKDVRDKLFQHIAMNAKSKGIYLDSINGHLDHVHCLISMNADLSIGKTVQLLKGESAHWANKINLVKPKLVWAEEYYAISISDSLVPKVRSYIESQDEKHGISTFQEDYNLYIKQYKF